MEGPLGRQQYVIYYIHIRLTFRLRRRSGFAVLRAAEGAQGAELSQGRVFQDFDEVVFIEWVHGVRKKFVIWSNVENE
jgi:hypothetical protein